MDDDVLGPHCACLHIEYKPIPVEGRVGCYQESWDFEAESCFFRGARK